MIFEKNRWEVWNLTQHPYKHSLSEFSYVNNALPGVSNVEAALNYILAVLYPKTKENVATFGDLPSMGNSLGDYRIVDDDGDGRSAGYRWEQREGDIAAQWYKVFDVDWSTDSILAATTDITQDLYFNSDGKSDLDEDGNIIAGLFAGQHVFGGNLANQNLTLNANSGDGVGAQTGFVQIHGNFRPTTDNLWDISTLTERWRDGFFSNEVVVGTLSLASSSITDSSGLIDFDNENLTTDGNITGAILTGAQIVADNGVNTMTLVPGSITDTSGTISFGAANLATSGTLGAGVATFTEGLETLIFSPDVSGEARITSSLGTINFVDENLITTGLVSAGSLTSDILEVDNLRLDGSTISTTNVDGDLFLNPNGVGEVIIEKKLVTEDQDLIGVLDVFGEARIDSLILDSGTITTDAGALTLDAFTTISVLKDVLPTGTLDLGSPTNLFSELHLSSKIANATNEILIADLLALRSTIFRDVGRTQPAQNGDALFYDSVNNVWLASVPDSEVDHGSISGLLDDDHTQYMLLAGRSGGQDLVGGSAASDDLTLESTSNVTKGFVRTKDDFVPDANASYSGSWSGLDLGDSTLYFRDLYTKGELKGARLENYTVATLPSASAQNIGRVVYATDNEKAYVDTGVSFKVLGVSKFVQDVSFDGAELTKNVSVSGISDARNATWQIMDNANDFETLFVVIKKTTASNVRIETSIPLPAGSYRLVGLE